MFQEFVTFACTCGIDVIILFFKFLPYLCLQKTPLFLACRSGHLDAVNVLMENGADVTALDSLTNLNCLDIAVENGHKYVVYCTAILCMVCYQVYLVLCTSHSTSVAGSACSSTLNQSAICKIHICAVVSMGNLM